MEVLDVDSSELPPPIFSQWFPIIYRVASGWDDFFTRPRFGFTGSTGSILKKDRELYRASKEGSRNVAVLLF